MELREGEGRGGGGGGRATRVRGPLPAAGGAALGTARAALALLVLAGMLPQAASQCTSGICTPQLAFPSTPVAGEITELQIKWTLQYDFQAGDYVEVYLPGFTGQLAAPTGVEFALEWDEGSKTLKVSQIGATPKAAGTEITASVLISAKISLPVVGVLSDQPDLTIRAVQALHPMGQTAAVGFSAVQAVGVMVNSTLAFNPSRVNDDTDIVIGFTHSSDIQGGESVSLFLADFVKAGASPQAGSASLQACGNPYLPSSLASGYPPSCSTGSVAATASTSGSGVLIVITIGDPITAGEQVTVTVPSDLQVSIPASGTPLNNINHVIGTSAALGPVNQPFQTTSPPGTSVESSPSVLSPTLAFSPAKLPTGECSSVDEVSGDCTAWVDESVDLTFGFSHSLALAASHYIELTLPLFTRQEYRQQTAGTKAVTSVLDCSGSNCDEQEIAVEGRNSSQIANASWVESTKLLRFTVTDAVASAGAYLEVTVPRAAGLKLPPSGLDEDTNFGYVVQSGATYTGLTVKATPPVGAFVASGVASSTLSLPSGRPSHATGLIVTFTLDSDIVASQCTQYCGTDSASPSKASVKRDRPSFGTVTLALASFSRLSGDLQHIVCSSSPSGAITSASWVESSSSLILTATSAVPAGTSVSVTVPSSAGIRPPQSGVPRNSPTLTIATDTQLGPVEATALAASDALGQLYGVTTSVSPATAGVKVVVVLSFKYSRDLAAGDSVTFELGRFSRTDPDGTLPAVGLTIGGATAGATVVWTTTNGQPSAVMTLDSGWSATAGQELSLTLRIENNIVSPPSGMPTVRPRTHWRVASNSALSRSWLVSDVSLFSDAACLTPITLSGATSSSSASSSGSTVPAVQPCSLNVSSLVRPNATASDNSSALCPSGTRQASFAELKACKRTLCDPSVHPEHVVAQADGGYLLGSLYGCIVAQGSSPLAAASLCTAAEAPASSAFDGSAATVWASAEGPEGYTNGSAPLVSWVQVQLPAAAAVRCAIVEQPGEAGDGWTAGSVLVQASDDGVSFVNVLGADTGGGGVARIDAEVSASAGSFEPKVRMSAATARGGVALTPLGSSTVVGSFSGRTRVAFSDPKAGQATGVVLAVTPVMGIAAGETITLHLGSAFTGTDVTGLALSMVRMVPVVTDEAQGTTEWREEVSFAPTGADHSWADGTYNNASGTVLLGAEEGATGDWTQSSGLVVLTLGVPLHEGQPVTFTLGVANAITLPSAGVGPSACGVGDMVPAVSCGTCTGCTGQSENNVWVSSNAAAGPVGSTAVATVQRVGVMTATGVSFGELRPNARVSVTATLTLNRPLAAGDAVTVHLAAEKYVGNATSGVRSGTAGFGACSWDPSAGLLVVMVEGSFAALAPVTFEVPLEAGVILPETGMLANSADVQLSTNASAGPVAAQVADSSPAMGTFAGDATRLSYAPAEFQSDGTPFLEGRVASITLGFALNRAIEAGEVVFANLFGFTRTGGDATTGDIVDKNGTDTGGNLTLVDTNGVFSNFVNASWDASNSRLSLTATSQVPSYQRHVVLIPSTAGIRLPSVGLAANDERIRIGTDAAAGPNTGTPVERSPSLARVCGAECAVWSLTCDACACGGGVCT